MAKQTTTVTEKVGGRQESETIEGFHYLRVNLLEADPEQPRKVFDAVKLKELAANIAEVGVIQNLTVRFVPQPFSLHEPDLTSKEWTVLNAAGMLVCSDSEAECRAFLKDEGGDGALKHRYVIVAGERRWRAAEIAGLDLVPCMVRHDGQLSAQDRFKVQHAENQEREGLSPLEEGESFLEAVEVKKLFTKAELAKELGMSPAHVYGRINLAKLPKVVKEAVASGKLNPALGELVAKVPGEKNQLAAMEEIMDGRTEYDHDTQKTVTTPMSVREAKRHLREHYMLDLEAAPFDVKSKTLNVEAGACKDCPKRSGNCVALFPELEKTPNVCTAPACYELKRKEHVRAATDALAVRGVTVVTGKEAKGLFGYGDNFDPYHQKSVDLKDVIPGDKQKRTYGQVLGKELPVKSAVVSPKGEVVEFFRKDLIEAALEQKGFKFKQSDDGKKSAEETAREERVAEARVKLGKELAVKIMAFAGASGPGEKETLAFLRWVAAGLVDMRFYSLQQIEHPLVKRFTNKKEIDKEAAKLKLGEAKSLLAGLVVGERPLGYGGWDEAFVSGCEYAGIDLKAQEKLVVKWAEADAAIDAKADLPGAKFEKEIAANKAKGPSIGKAVAKKKKK